MAGSPRPPLPEDRGIPAADRLLDPTAAGALLGAAVPDASEVVDWRLRYLEYRPGRSLTVQYEAVGPASRVDVGAIAGPDGVEVFAYPNDPGLAALAEPEHIIAAFGLPPAPIERLAWVPTQRVTLRIGPTVVKLYRTETEAADAWRRMLQIQGMVPTAEPVGLQTGLRAVAQTLVDGEPLDRVGALAGAAGAVDLLTRLRRAVPGDVPVLGPAEVLALAAAPIELISFVRPDLAGRLETAAEQLAASAPSTTGLMPAHGDFNVGQLLATERGLAVVDVDTLCLASPAFDLASYATNVVSGRPADLAAAHAVLAELRRTIDGQHPDLDWYVAATLLRRVDRAVRRMKRDWPDRTDRLVEAVEASIVAAGVDRTR